MLARPPAAQLLGETAVGKSSLALRFARDQFLEYQESTIGAAFLTQSVIVDGNTIKFEIWDTAGQERYHSLAPMVRLRFAPRLREEQGPLASCAPVVENRSLALARQRSLARPGGCGMLRRRR